MIDLEELFSFLTESTRTWAEPLLIFVFWLALLGGLRSLAFHWLRKLAQRTPTDLHDRILSGLSWPTRMWVFLLALVPAVGHLRAQVVKPALARSLSVVFLVLVLVSVVAALSHLSLLVIAHVRRRQGHENEVTSLTEIVVRTFWAVPALLLLFDRIGLNVTPYLTGLGVGGVIAGFALKDTLANLFAGFYVGAGGNFHKGDYVKLSSGEEGHVADIKWRLTTLRTLQGNLILIPNSKMVEAVLTNYSYPASRMAYGIEFSVGYATDLELLERIVLEEAKGAAAEQPGLLKQPAPSVQLTGFGESGLKFALSFWIADYKHQGEVADRLRRRLLVRFRKEGIQIPFPVRTIQIESPE